jgi:hypothetical protein
VTEIRDTATALIEAEQILFSRIDRQGADHIWESQAVAPLAAILLSTTDPIDNRMNLDRARATAAVTVAAPNSNDQASWVQAALHCPDLPLGEALARVLAMEVRQRDSIQSVMLEALNR